MFEVEYLVFSLHCFADNKLLYLDPHLCRDAVDTTASDFKTEVRETLLQFKLGNTCNPRDI